MTSSTGTSDIEANRARSLRVQVFAEGIDELGRKIAALECEGPAGEWKREMHRQSIAVLEACLRDLA